MPAGAECDCTAQLLRSFRALHILHRDAQRTQVTRRNAPIDELTYFRVVVVLAVVVVVECGREVVVVGTVNCRLKWTGPIGWATR